MPSNFPKNNINFKLPRKTKRDKSFQITSSKPSRQWEFYGRCTKFKNCGFAHEELCKFQDWCFKNECQFVHLKGSFLDQWKRMRAKM